MAQKIEIEKLSNIRNKFLHKNIGITFSCWDLMHSGHHLFLEFCKKNCDINIVGLQTDPIINSPDKNKPVQSLIEREIQLKSCRYVDYYFIYDNEESLYNSLLILDPNVRFLGDDYINKRFTGDDLPIEIKYHIRSFHDYSTSNLRKKIFQIESEKEKTQLCHLIENQNLI